MACVIRAPKHGLVTHRCLPMAFSQANGEPLSKKQAKGQLALCR